MYVNSSSRLYREINLKEIHTIQSKHFGSQRILSAKPLTGGLFNTTYLLELSDSTAVVLRLGPVNKHLLLPFEHHLMAASAWGAELFHQHGVPTAKVITYDETLDALDRAYLLMEYIPGKTLFDLEPSYRESCYHDAGVLTRRIHSIQGEKFGRLADIACGGGYDSWSDALIAEVNDYIIYAERSGLFDTDTLNRISVVYSKYSAELDEISLPLLSHGDLWPSNIITNDIAHNGNYRVAAIIDIDRAMFGDPEFDFPSGHVPNDTFRRGYGGEINQNGNAVIRHKLYALLYSMLGYYALNVQHAQVKQSLHHRKQIDQLLKELM